MWFDIFFKEAAYGSRDEPPTMTRLMQGDYAGKPGACTLCGNSPVVAGAQFRNPLGNINYTHHLCEPCADQYGIMHSADVYKGEPMDIALRLLKRQTTLSAFDGQQIQENLKPENSNIFIAAKPGKEETRPGELSQLSDNMLAELAALKEKHGVFGITSATGNAGWELEPSFMLTNVPQSARDEIHAIAEKYRQHSIAVSEQNETGAKFLDSQGNVTYTDGQEDSFRTMQMDPDAEYSTDFPTGQRLTFKSEPMDIAMRLLKEEDDVPDMSKFGLPIQRPTFITYRDGVTKPIPYEMRGQKYEFKSPTNEREMRAEAGKQRRVEQETPIPKVSPTMNEVENQPTWPTNTPYNEETGFTRSEPMEIAMRLLKEARPHALMSHEELHSKLKEKRNMFYMVSDDPSNEYAELMKEVILREKEKVRFPIPKIEIKDDGTEDITYPYPNSTGMTFDTDFQDINTGEPMEIAMRLLKERVSPEAKQHKLEYDKKYESSPERVKYREELNRERRRRHIMGQGGPDMSHTSQHTIVPEDPHTNRARHFKDKGTLL